MNRESTISSALRRWNASKSSSANELAGATLDIVKENAWGSLDSADKSLIRRALTADPLYLPDDLRIIRKLALALGLE